MSFQQQSPGQATVILNPSELSPGDARCATADLSRISFARIRSIEDPAFTMVYDFLHAEFGDAYEIETRNVLERRLQWQPEVAYTGYAMLYEMIAVFEDRRLIAARDHTAIVRTDLAEPGLTVVHLSHALIAPDWRRSGVGGWLRALPIQTAGECLTRAGQSPHLPITLVAEMEMLDASDPSRLARLSAYEKAGFLKIDRQQLRYHQPDFRPPKLIDAAPPVRPLPMNLLLRRHGSPLSSTLSGAEVRAIVDSIYTMYAREFRASDMQAVLSRVSPMPDDQASIALLAPTT